MNHRFNIPENKLPASMLARRAMLAASTGRNGVQAEAIANADAHASNVGLPTYSALLRAAEEIWNSGHPDAPLPRGITEGEFGNRLVQIAGKALGQL